MGMKQDQEQIQIERFWKWAYSDLRENQFNLGLLAEFLVVRSLKGEEYPRNMEKHIDIIYRERNITVKGTKSSKEYFDGKRSILYQSLPSSVDIHCYIFCLFIAENDSTNPLITSNWKFAVMKKGEIGDRKSISWNTIEKILAMNNRKIIDYSEIRSEADKILDT